MRLGRRLKGTLNRHLKKLKGLRLKKIVKNECEAYRIYLNPSTETYSLFMKQINRMSHVL